MFAYAAYLSPSFLLLAGGLLASVLVQGLVPLGSLHIAKKIIKGLLRCLQGFVIVFASVCQDVYHQSVKTMLFACGYVFHRFSEWCL